jgi:hypothetical protein
VKDALRLLSSGVAVLIIVVVTMTIVIRIDRPAPVQQTSCTSTTAWH